MSQLCILSGQRVSSAFTPSRSRASRRSCVAPRNAVEHKALPYALNALEGKGMSKIVLSTWNNGSPTPEFNNAAQIFNHEFFWESIAPNGGGEPTGDLKAAIDKTFGSFEDFKKQFSAAGATQFGSGWAWLVSDKGKLAVIKTPNAENPLHQGKTPLLTMDVWEHAYYVDFRNRRPDFIGNFFNLINWDKVAERYAE